MKKKLISSLFLVIVLLLASVPLTLQARTPEICRDSLLSAAREIITEIDNCALISTDSAGIPHVRTMSQFPFSSDFNIWFATSRYSLKVNEIRHNPNVCVYFADHARGNGYVAVNGKAEIIDDPALLVKKKRDYWDGIPGWKELFVLIRIVPEKLEVVNYPRGVSNDPKTSKAPSVIF